MALLKRSSSSLKTTLGATQPTTLRASITGVTRGKRLVVLVGQKKAVAIAVRNASGRRRWSKFGEWLAFAAGGRIEKARNGATRDNRLQGRNPSDKHP
jgi:hypothetical protein